MKIFLLDNYDSFTYNLYQYLQIAAPEAEIVVRRNDAFELAMLADFDAIVLSPGPGIPSEAGLLLAVIQQYAASKPILGICLGHQAIAEAFGGRLLRLEKVFHGIKTPIRLATSPQGLFKGLEEEISVGRYHSWVVDPDSFPPILTITATDASGAIMALEHQALPIFGLQFHPESVLTESGQHLINNFIKIVAQQTSKRYEKQLSQTF